MARAQGAEVINFNEENPVEVLRELTGGSGPDRAIDAVGVDAEAATAGPAAAQGATYAKEFGREMSEVAKKTDPHGDNWHPGGAPSQALWWAVQGLAKAGTLSIIGVYPPQLMPFPIGRAMNKNLRVNMGNTHHRRYIPRLLDLVAAGVVDPLKVLTQREPMTDALTACKQFDQRKPGWIKVRGQEDLEHWADMVTTNAYRDARDSEGLSAATLQHGGEMLQRRPRLRPHHDRRPRRP